MKRASALIAAGITFALAAGHGHASTQPKLKAGPAPALTTMEIRSGMKLEANEAGKYMLTRKGFHSVCLADGKLQLVVPLSVSMSIDDARAKGLKANKRIAVFDTIEAQIPKLLKELGEKPIMLSGLPSGTFDIVFIEQMRAFKEGVAAAYGVPVTMTRHDRVVMTQGCEPVKDEAAFVAARDNFMQLVKSIQDRLRDQMRRKRSPFMEAKNAI